jgi:hypothetical protein
MKGDSSVISESDGLAEQQDGDPAWLNRIEGSEAPVLEPRLRTDGLLKIKKRVEIHQKL